MHLFNKDSRKKSSPISLCIRDISFREWP